MNPLFVKICKDTHFTSYLLQKKVSLHSLHAVIDDYVARLAPDCFEILNAVETKAQSAVFPRNIYRTTSLLQLFCPQILHLAFNKVDALISLVMGKALIDVASLFAITLLTVPIFMPIERLLPA